MGEEKKKKHKKKKDSKDKKKDLKDGKEKKESKNDKKIKDAKDDKKKTKKGRGFSFFGKKSKVSKDDKKKKDLKDEKRKKGRLRKQHSTTKSPDAAAAAHGGTSGQRGTPNQETAVEFSPHHKQKPHATPSRQKKPPEGFPEPYTVPNIEKFKIPNSTSEQAIKKISSFEHLKQPHRPRHLETVEQPKLSQLQQSSGLKLSGDGTPTKQQQKSKEKVEKPHKQLQPPSTSGIKSSSKSGKRVVRTSKSGEKLFQRNKSKSGSKSGKQNLDSQELFINTISPQNIQKSCGKKNNLSKNLENKKKDGINEEKPKKQKEQPKKSSEPKSSDKGSNKDVQQQKSITPVISNPKEYEAKKLLKFSNQKTSTSKSSDRRKTKSPKKKLDRKSSFSKLSPLKGRKYLDKTKIKSSKKKLSTSKSNSKRRKDISSDLIQKSSDKGSIKNVQQQITPVINDPKEYTTKKPLKSSDQKITKGLKKKSDRKKSNSKSSTEGRKYKSPDKKKNAKSPKKKLERKKSTSKSNSKRRKEKKKEESSSKSSEKRQQKLVVKKSVVVFPMKKKERSLMVNVNEVLRIGSVLERYGLDEQRRKAFEWLAENRNEALKDSPKFAYNLMVAIGDLNISQDLVIKILQIFLQNGSINQKEYHKHFAPLERSTIHISVAQFAHLLNVYGSQYQSSVAEGS